MLYRKRAHAADTESAIQWTGDNLGEVKDFCAPTLVAQISSFTPESSEFLRGHVLIADQNFPMWLEVGEFITKTDAGELDVWDQEHFHATYERAGFIGPRECSTPAPVIAPAISPVANILLYMLDCYEKDLQPLQGLEPIESQKLAWDETARLGLITLAGAFEACPSGDPAGIWALTWEGLYAARKIAGRTVALGRAVSDETEKAEG